uniref:Putative secreted protein n=1 Tax=Anopheles marajoara TaxID=58244 RepID=A0A2M4CAG1_9DIPT
MIVTFSYSPPATSSCSTLLLVFVAVVAVPTCTVEAATDGGGGLNVNRFVVGSNLLSRLNSCSSNVNGLRALANSRLGPIPIGPAPFDGIV